MKYLDFVRIKSSTLSGYVIPSEEDEEEPGMVNVQFLNYTRMCRSEDLERDLKMELLQYNPHAMI